ncbi:MAG: tetratricopeptide repeat protein [Candidatus Poribacteria bacterium]|nr:tetratricopeptide repeat protein [Candidatus Poribacteria bacterium]
MLRKLSYYTVTLVAFVVCHFTFWQVLDAFCQETLEAVDITTRIRAYKSELAVDGTRIETRLQLAKVYLQIAAYTEAVDEYHRIIASMEANTVPRRADIEHNSDVSAAYYGLGLAYAGLEKFGDAVAAYQRAIASVPDWAYTHAALASAYANMHRYTEALDAYKVAVALDPNDEMIHHQLGNVYSKRGERSAAMQHQQRAIAIAPEFAAAHYQLGLLHAQEKRWPDAIASYRTAYAHDETLVEALYNLAQASLRAGDPSAAREQMALFEKQKAALMPLQQLRGALQRAQRTAERAQILTNIARLYLKNGFYEKAVWEYQKALGMDPELVLAYNGLGIAYTMLGKHSEAVTAQRKALELQPNFAKAYAGLGLAYFSQNEAESALQHYRHAAVLEPQFLEAHLKIGTILLKQRRYAEAIDTYKTSASLAPDNAEIYHNLGMCYARQAKSDLEAARRYAQEAIRLDPNVSSYYNTLALIDFRRGDYPQAEKAIRKALELEPENQNYQQGLSQILESR